MANPDTDAVGLDGLRERIISAINAYGSARAADGYCHVQPQESSPPRVALIALVDDLLSALPRAEAEAECKALRARIDELELRLGMSNPPSAPCCYVEPDKARGCATKAID